MAVRILLVEDDEVLHPLFRYIFTKKFHHCAITIVTHYLQAMDIIENLRKKGQHFDVIISDVNLLDDQSEHRDRRTGVDLLESSAVKYSDSKTFLISSERLLTMEKLYRSHLPETVFISKPLNFSKCQAILGLR